MYTNPGKGIKRCTVFLLLLLFVLFVCVVVVVVVVVVCLFLLNIWGGGRGVRSKVEEIGERRIRIAEGPDCPHGPVGSSVRSVVVVAERPQGNAVS